jgi:hypothetical protein
VPKEYGLPVWSGEFAVADAGTSSAGSEFVLEPRIHSGVSLSGNTFCILHGCVQRIGSASQAESISSQTMNDASRRYRHRIEKDLRIMHMALVSAALIGSWRSATSRCSWGP